MVAVSRFSPMDPLLVLSRHRPTVDELDMMRAMNFADEFFADVVSPWPTHLGCPLIALKGFERPRFVGGARCTERRIRPTPASR